MAEPGDWSSATGSSKLNSSKCGSCCSEIAKRYILIWGSYSDIDFEPEQLNGIYEFEEAAQIDPEQEQLNEIFEVEEAAQIDPEQEELNEIFEFEEAAQIDPEQE